MSEPIKVNLNGTACIHCIFAKYDENNVQTDCSVNRIEKFKEQGANINQMSSNGKTFFFVENRICLMCCTPKTVEVCKMKNPAEDMRQNIALKCATYIIVNKDDTSDKVIATIDSLLSQTHFPAKINVIFNSQIQITRASILVYLRQKAKSDTRLLWNFTTIHDIGPNGEMPSTEWCIDHGVQNCEEPFYAVFLPGFEVPEDYLKSIDKALNDDLQKFSILLPVDDWNGAFVQTKIHKLLNGNIPEALEKYEDGELVATSIMDKIEFIAQKDEKPFMVKKVEEICPSMKR